jgi:RHS repeat-associated protein
VTDHLGSPRLVLDGQGRALGRAAYGPYGEPLAGGTPDPVTAFRFSGARRQEGSGLLVMGWRHYDPALGRFLEPDPVVASPHDPEAFNRYTYARDNPVNITDPDGRSPVVPILFWTAVLLLDRDTRVDVAGSVALTAATIFLTGALGPGPAAGLSALKASVPALYAAAASTAILRTGMGEAVVSGYAGLLDDLGLSPRASQATARLTAAWFLNSSLQRGFSALLASKGAARGGDPLGDRAGLDAALEKRRIDPQDLGSPSRDAYGTTVQDAAGRNGATTELERFGEVIDGSGNVIGVYGVRDLGPFFDHGAFASIGGNAGPAISGPHYAYALGGISTQQFARDLFASGYSGSLFALTGRTTDFLIEMAYGPYGGGLALGIDAANGSGSGGDH